MDGIRERLKELRWKVGLNQGKFAAKMGVKQNTWANIERGTNPCSDRYVNLMCLTFNVRKDWLLNGEGDIFEPDSPKPAFENTEKSLPSNVNELISIYQELVPLNQKAVMDFLETTLQAQRNTVKAIENKNIET